MFFSFTDTATPEIYTLSLHDRSSDLHCVVSRVPRGGPPTVPAARHRPALHPGLRTASRPAGRCRARSEEHTSELQSLTKLVCRLLLEKKKRTQNRFLPDWTQLDTYNN